MMKEQPTHAALPIPLLQEIVKVLQSLPYAQVAGVMGAIQQSQMVVMPQQDGVSREVAPDTQIKLKKKG